MEIREAAHLICERVLGTPNDIMSAIDIMKEEGDIDEAFFDNNELEILRELDDLVFNCEVCGWNCEAGDWAMNSTMGDLVCSQCGENEDA